MTSSAPSTDRASTPIVVSDLGVVRERRVREAAKLRVALPEFLVAGLALGLSLAAPFIAGQSDLVSDVVRAIVVVAFVLAATIDAALRPNERLPAIVLTGALLGAIATLSDALLRGHANGAVAGGALIDLARFAMPFALALLPVSAMHFLLGLPDGRCRLGRAAIAGGYVVGVGVGAAIWAVRPRIPLWPIGVELLVALAIGLVACRRRYARSTGAERHRLQWFGWALAVGLEVLVVSVGLRILWGWPTRGPLVVALATIPIAIAIAASGFPRLSARIDRILAHTVSFAGLSIVIVAVYLVILVGTGTTPSHTDRALLALSMAAAAICALVYGPARVRLTQYANRVVYGEREAPDAVLRTFGSRLSRAIPLDELLLQVAESLRKTLALSSAEVWTGSGGQLERTVSVPDRPVEHLRLAPEEESVVARAGVTGNAWLEVWMPALLAGREGEVLRVAPTTHTGRVLGLIVAVRPPGGDRFTEDDDTMLTELARQLGLALHNVELDSALQETLDEVRRQALELQASRARIVAASDAARRQIERNLHDGAQQHLVALAVNVRLARRLVDTDPAGSAEILDELGVELQDAVQELRALAHGIYPPLLSDRGIEEALRSAATRAALPTEVETSGLRRYSPEVEAAVYFCCLEAMQNAGKHAGETATITVRVFEHEGALSFEVRDTGGGFDAASSKTAGAGFVNMRDRVGAIGGSIAVRSALGEGTSVTGRLPIAESSDELSRPAAVPR